MVDIRTPFYKLAARTNQGDYVPFFVLGREDIGHKISCSQDVLDGVAKMFHIPPLIISNPDGAIDLLIGLE